MEKFSASAATPGFSFFNHLQFWPLLTFDGGDNEIIFSGSAVCLDEQERRRREAWPSQELLLTLLAFLLLRVPLTGVQGGNAVDDDDDDIGENYIDDSY